MIKECRTILFFLEIDDKKANLQINKPGNRICAWLREKKMDKIKI